ncbi:MAG TPA: hypothetical protein PLS95_00940 [Thermoanaerobaculales bacterium]|nr:hypothetical protein [Thermoanaerobaculales bacterium]
MRLAASLALLGWASLTAGIAALTTPWAWAISAGVALLAAAALRAWDAVLAEQEETEGGDR